ncbi:MAG: phosphoethanolamine transferase domain-containing protein, partial [Wohlfahrtiimonas sp.]
MKMPPKLNLSLFSALIVFAIVFVATQNIAFWAEFGRLMTFDSARSYIFTISVSLVLCSGLVIILSLLLWSRLTYPMLAVLLVLSTLFNYYSYHYQIYMDRDMLINVIETNTLEVYDLVSFKMLGWLIIGAVIPFLILTRIKIKPSKWWKSGLQRVALIVASVFVVGAIALVFYKDYASFFRNNRQVVKLIMPSSYITSYVSYARKNYAQNMPYTIVGDDAVLSKPKE